MKVAYVTTYDAQNVKNWSGLGYFIAQALANQSLSLEFIGDLEQKCSNSYFKNTFFTYKWRLYNKLTTEKYLKDREPWIVKDFAKQGSLALMESDVDLVFSPGSIPLAYIESAKPIVFWADATFAGMVDFYPEFTNLCPESLRHGNALEQAALDNCSLAIYSSQWAAESAITNYQVNPAKVKVVPFGANITCDRNLEDIKTMISAKKSNVCQLLFIGVDWHRKGGDVALAVAEELNQRGLATVLTIVGVEPPIKPLPDFVRSLGFISKSTPQGREKLDSLFAESHFLIVPSVAECFGLVFCEANSFGVPCIATNVGGIPTIIKDELNGKLFDLHTDIINYCNYIESIFTDYSRYKQMALDAFDQYKSRLNWSVAGKSVKDLFLDLV
jgi:glycosyltransferase involved in cell wall biosynthesis